MSTLLVVVLAAVLAFGTYFGLERLGRRALWPAVLRFAAWTSLGLLLANAACPRPPERRRPLALIDASLSMDGPGWAAARRAADSLGEVRFVGDDRPGTDTTASRGRSLVATALIAAAAGDRPVWLVTDGEIEDRTDIPPDVLTRTGVRLLPRRPPDDIAIVDVDGADRLTRGDTIRVEVTLLGTGTRSADSVTVRLRADGAGAPLATRRIRLASGAARMALSASTGALSPGEHLLRVELADHRDAEIRTDVRLHHLVLAATPGAVLVTSPGDWEGRFLFRTIREVSDLPLRGYVELAPGDWRSMRDLSRVTASVVRDAARQADLLIARGDAVSLARGSRARGVWLWPGGSGSSLDVADWYLVPMTDSPLAAALAGLPLDSFPPVAQLARLDPAPTDWVAFTAQAGRRGAPRAAMIGRARGRTREVISATDGLWRWRFRGGSSEQGYRSLVAATVSWLLAAPDSATGLARPVRAVVQQGRPVMFQWTGSGPAHPVMVTVDSGSAARVDSLRFDGAGRAALWLAPGRYRYRLQDGVGGLVAVERYSDEFLPRAAVLTAQDPADVTGSRQTSPRDWPWLFGIAVAALCGEWVLRRRLGLR